MSISGTLSNYYKYMKNKGAVNFLGQYTGSLTFSGATIALPGGAVSAAACGFAIGQTIYTTSTAGVNAGPFVITGISSLTMTVINASTGASPTLTADATSNTIGTSLVKVMLMRAGFSFLPGTHKKITNVVSSVVEASGTYNVTVSLTNTIALSSTPTSNFSTAGFIPGNFITLSGFTGGLTGNNNTYMIQTVSAYSMTLLTTAGAAPSLTNGVQSSGNVTFTTSDEWTSTTQYGYTVGGLLATPPALTEDDTSNNWGQITFPNLTWGASGGAIGPAASALLYNADGTIIGNMDFGGSQTALSGTNFTVAGITLRDT